MTYGMLKFLPFMHDVILVHIRGRADNFIRLAGCMKKRKTRIQFQLDNSGGYAVFSNDQSSFRVTNIICFKHCMIIN